MAAAESDKAGLLDERGGSGLLPSSVKAAVIWETARALSMGEMGMSPQSTILAQLVWGLRFARRLKPMKLDWRLEA